MESLQERVNAFVESSKQKYYYQIANKLNNTQTNSKKLMVVTKNIFKQKKYHLFLDYFTKIAP